MDTKPSDAPERPSGESDANVTAPGPGGSDGGSAPGGSNGGPGGSGGGSSSSSVSHTGANTYSSDVTLINQSWTSSNGAENTVLVEGGNVTIKNSEILKFGDDSGDSSDFYGTNAALFAYNDAKVTVVDTSVRTDGSHANAVFAYGNATIDISASTITTSSNNSGGIMVTGGGTIKATNLDVSTAGNSSAAIRSDRGGGTIIANGGTYATSGTGSPVIYSTADITVFSANLTSTASEGVVIEGKNSVTLDGVTMTATNNKLNGQSQTYKTIFIYQSMSGDASEGTGTFSASNSKITTNQGDHFFVTNTTAVINLTNNKFVQNDAAGGFLKATASAWGNSGSNGGKVTLNANDQEVIGSITIDSVSSLDMNLSHSYFKGAVSNEGTVNLTVSADSIVVLTGDSYVTSLTNADSSNANIYGNGYKLYVNGKEVATNSAAAPESFLTFDEEMLITEVDASTLSTVSESSFPTWGYFAIGGAVAALVIICVVAIVMKKKGKKAETPDLSNLVADSETPINPEKL